MPGGTDMLVFETSKLLLEPLNQSEWENYLEHLDMYNEYYFQYGYEDKDELLPFIQTPGDMGIYYTIKKSGTNEMVGYVGITPELDELPYDNLEIYIFNEYRREGYAYEALSVIIDEYLRGRLTERIPQEIVAETLYENKPTIYLLEKLGFVKEAFGLRISLDNGGEGLQPMGIRRYVRRYENIN